MTKQEIPSQLREAKAAHVNWVQHAKMLISGLEMKEEAIPVNATQCKFGRWFYSDGQALSGLRNNTSEQMAEIEQLHF
jgi:hypothetical protein